LVFGEKDSYIWSALDHFNTSYDLECLHFSFTKTQLFTNTNSSGKNVILIISADYKHNCSNTCLPMTALIPVCP